MKEFLAQDKSEDPHLQGWGSGSGDLTGKI